MAEAFFDLYFDYKVLYETDGTADCCGLTRVLVVLGLDRFWRRLVDRGQVYVAAAGGENAEDRDVDVANGGDDEGVLNADAVGEVAFGER